MYNYTKKIVAAALFLSAFSVQAAVPLDWKSISGHSRTQSDTTSLHSRSGLSTSSAPFVEHNSNNNQNTIGCKECVISCFEGCADFIKFVTYGLCCTSSKDSNIVPLTATALEAFQTEQQRLLASKPRPGESENEYNTFNQPDSENDSAALVTN